MTPEILAYLTRNICASDPVGEFFFGPWKIDSTQIFLLSPRSYATVNLKPLVPGHVLVIPRRNVERMNELSPEEISDLYQAVQAVGELVQRRHKKSALTICTQDGKDAGQTVPHVHVHVLPRSPTDFKTNDDVYEALDNTDLNRPCSKGPDCEDRPPRKREEMAAEAADLRAFGKKFAAGEA